MDPHTHILFSKKLLESCSKDTSCAVYSLLPSIDKIPFHFHRLYTHNIQMIPELVEEGIRIIGKKEKPKKTYISQRIYDELPYFEKVNQEVVDEFDIKEITDIGVDKISTTLSVLTHLYLDAYNNPTQIYLPEEVYCAGKWELWRKVDFLKLREHLYKNDSIKTFRRKTLSLDLWKTKLESDNLFLAMLQRLIEMTRPKTRHKNILEKSFRKIRDPKKTINQQVFRDEYRFCLTLEEKIDNIIQDILNKY